MLSALMYRCPGETYDIDRSVHLGRLAAFYSKCSGCPHHGETATLPRETVRHLAAVHARIEAGPTITAEGVIGVYRNQLTPAIARTYAAALGVYLREHADADAPAVVVAGDGRPLSPEFVAAACDGLRWAGCRTVDLGATTSACLVHAIGCLPDARGGLLVGNPTSDPHIVGLKFWRPAGSPLSQGSGLDELDRLASEPLARPVRTYGGLDRANLDDSYLADVCDDFHALRPLRFILDSGCGPLWRYLSRLVATVACEIIEAVEPRRSESPARDARAGKSAARRPPALPGRPPESRIAALAQQVRERAAHFGLWVDGDGEACHLVDELGQSVSGEVLLLVLARHVLGGRLDAAVVVENTTSSLVVSTIQKLGARVVVSNDARAAMHAALCRSGATIGGGPSGRLFHVAGAPPALPSADALKTLSLLLAALSTSDRPLSQVAALG